MALFHHPHLTRGLVKTAQGAFSVSRGVVDVPDEIGESLGWQPVRSGDDAPLDAPLRSSTHGESASDHTPVSQQRTQPGPSSSDGEEQRDAPAR